MVTRAILSVVAICAMATSAFPRIWQVNSNPGVSADFATVQEAHDGAASGDTLYVAGSPISYGDLTADRTLYIYGTGYFLDENLHSQAHPVPCRMGAVSFQAGSEGSYLSGASLPSPHNAYTSVYVGANNITLRKNRIEGIVSVADNVVNAVIGQNYLKSVQIGSLCSNIAIFNNLFHNLNTRAIDGQSDASADVTGNVIEDYYAGANALMSIYNSTLIFP